MLKYLGMITQPSGETGVLGLWSIHCVKNSIDCGELYAVDNFEILAIEVKAGTQN
jgi:hypothetical protein